MDAERDPGTVLPDGTGPRERRGNAAAWRRFTIATTVLAAVALALLLVGREPAAEATTYELVFSPGTAVGIDPAIFAPIPHRRVGDVVWLELELGDTLVVRNDDGVEHVLWALAVRPGEAVSHTFREYGTFTGECSFDMTVFIEVR